MSQAKWCDVGQHAFSAGQPGATTVKVEQQVKNQWGGYQPTDTVQDICAACAKDMGVKNLGRLADVPEDELEKAAEETRERSGGRFGGFGGRRAIQNGPSAKDKYLQDVAAGKPNPEYIKWLEDEAAQPVGTDIDEELRSQ